MMNNSLAAYYSQLEQQRGLPAGYLARTRAIESGNGKNLLSPTGAKGDFQFTRGTAKAMGLSNPMDPVESARAAADLAAQNRSILQRALGRVPSGPELYLAHQQGGGGAAALLSNPDKAAGSVTAANNIAVNSGDPNAPAKGFINKFIDRYNTAKPDVPIVGGQFGLGGAEAVTGTAPVQGPPIPADYKAPAEPPKMGGIVGQLVGDKPMGGLISMAQQEGPVTGTQLSNFLGSSDMTSAMKGGGILASALAAPPVKPAVVAPLQAEDHMPDMSLLAMLKKRQGGLLSA